MTTSTGTEPNPSGDGSPQDAVPPADGSQGEKDKSPGEDWVPKKRFVAALNDVTARADSAEQEARRLREEVAELRAGQKAQAPKPPTLAELRQMVLAGDITQEQADALYEKQLIERTKRVAVDATGQVLSDKERLGRVTAELQGYKELVPDAWVPGSPERDKAAKEYRHLVADLGYPEGTATEAAALRAAFGDLATLRQSRSARPGPADTHAETGGGKPESGGGGKSDVLKNLSSEKKQYYQRQIDSGRYKDWGEVRAELEFRPKAKS